MPRPDATEYASSYAAYVNLVPEEDILRAMVAQLAEMLAFLRAVSESEAGKRHAPYTWSVKEVVGHMTDAERIFGGRAFRFSRGDATPLPGFDENEYVRAAGFDGAELVDLVFEFGAVRRGNLYFLRRLSDEAWSRSGVANGNPITVRALAYALVGHARHHTAILRRRLAGA